MLNSIINKYLNKPNFTHQLFTTQHAQFYSLPAHTTTRLLINYTEAGCYHSHIFWVSSLHPGEFQFSTGLTYQIINSETGELLGLFYGFGNTDFNGFLDSLISNGTKFEIHDKWGETPTNLYHGQYKRLKSGKWRKYEI